MVRDRDEEAFILRISLAAIDLLVDTEDVAHALEGIDAVEDLELHLLGFGFLVRRLMLL
jgi:hypothetical protein